MVTRERDLGRKPFSSEIQHTLQLNQKALSVLGPGKGWCAHSSLVGVLSTMRACSPASLFWAPSDADTGLQFLRYCNWHEIDSHGLQSPVEEKGQHRHSLEGKAPGPLPWQAFNAFLGTLHWGWSSFTMHRFSLGGYFLQKTKERMLLITSKRKDICKCKGKSGWPGYTCPWKVQHRF